jgi:hypothetical protein
MRTAENPLAGNKHHSDNPFDMDKLPLDEMIDRLINSDELSLTLTATPQLAEKVWYLMENTCIRAFTAGDLQAKNLPSARFSSFTRPGWLSRYPWPPKTSFTPAHQDPELHRVRMAAGGKETHGLP